MIKPTQWFFFFWMFWISSGWAIPLEFSEGAVLRDAEVEEILMDFSSPLLKTAGITPHDVKIYLVASKQMNAFATLGNMIFVNTGLITQCRQADELIGVLAHEIGHLAGRHVVQSIEAMKNASNQALLAAVLGGIVAGVSGRIDAGLASLMGGMHVAERSFLSYNRGQESAADQAAIRFLKNLHWPLTGLSLLMERFKDQEFLTTAKQDLYVRTHPLGKERLDAIAHHLEHTPKGYLPLDFSKKFQILQAKISAYTFAEQTILQKYPLHDTSALARYARSIAFYRSGHYEKALNELHGAVPLSAYMWELKAQILFERKKINEAVSSIDTALKIKPESTLLKITAASIMIESQNPTLLSRALSLLNTLPPKEKDDSEVWRLLSVAYGQQKNMGLMSLSLAEMALKTGDSARAKTQAQRACHFLKQGTPAYQRAQDILENIK